MSEVTDLPNQVGKGYDIDVALLPDGIETIRVFIVED